MLALMLFLAACGEPAAPRAEADGAVIAATMQSGDDCDDDDDDDDDDDCRTRELEYAAREIVLVGISRAQERRLVEAGFTSIARRRIALLGGDVVRLGAPVGLSESAALGRARALLGDIVGDLNHIYRLQQSSPCSGAHCATLRAMAWPEQFARCGANLRIGVVDTDVVRTHQALRGRAIEVHSALAPGRDPAGADHGTAIVALIVGRADGPAPGLAPRARVIAVNAFHADAAGRAQADAVDLAAALDRVSRANVRVVNMSFAGPSNEVLERSVAALAARGVTLVAAMGNDARATPRFPAAYPSVLAITAVDTGNRLYRLANTGPHVAFAAPGVAILAADEDGTGVVSGTSYATALASAVIMRERGRANHEAALAAVRARAMDLGAPGRDARSGWGLIRADGAPC